MIVVFCLFCQTLFLSGAILATQPHAAAMPRGFGALQARGVQFGNAAAASVLGFALALVLRRSGGPRLIQGQAVRAGREGGGEGGGRRWEGSCPPEQYVGMRFIII